ncbi:MAG: hypothetical protein ACRDHF_01185 [Tepidiformaceae bacterium]
MRWPICIGVAGILLGAVVASGLWLTGDSAGADVQFEENGQVVSAAMSQDDAIREASERLGFTLRVPGHVPAGFVLTHVRADVGPVGPDQDGVIRDLSSFRIGSIVYRHPDGTLLMIDQFPPERSTKGVYGSRPADPGVGGVESEFFQRTQAAHLTWDSTEATYTARLAHRDGGLPADAEAILLAVLRSMN